MRTEQQIRAELDHVTSRKRRLSKELRNVVRKSRGLPPKKRGMGCRIGDRDEALKAARGYVEPGSFVRRDGSEKLVGRDWRKRVGELEERSGGVCEYRAPSVWVALGVHRCAAAASDPHHVVRRSVRRDDRLSNLQHLCRPHHDALDPRKVRSGKLGA